MSALQVLCPNGRRQNVKITPTTKLLQVLEDVCQKQKFMPPENYKLVHGRTTVDLTLSVRYANLPNNAKLELVKAEKSRAESEVLIALQLASSERLQHTFSPGTSLWEVLLHWENQPDSPHKDVLTKVDTSQKPSVQPVCIYMREEITGELALKETQLRNLGLTGGKAAIRLLHRQVDDETLLAIAKKIETEKIKKARLTQSSTPKSSQQSTSSAAMTTSSASSSTSSVTMDTQSVAKETKTEIKTETATISLNINVNIQNDGNAKASVESSDKVEKEDGPSSKVCKIEAEPEQSHDQAEPMEVEPPQTSDHMEIDEVTSSSSSDKQMDRDSGTSESRRDAVNRLREVPGLEVFTPDDFTDLPPEQQEVARRLAQSFLANLTAQGMAIPGQNVPTNGGKKKITPKPTAAPFMDFKFPEATKGQELYKNELGTAKREDFQPCDRKTLVFSVEETTKVPSSDSDRSDLPEDFFELTETDVRSLLKAQRKRLKEMEDQPLMTSAMRKAKLEAEYSRYEKVVMRVQFQDKCVLQGVFRPRETVFALKKFVKENLEDKSLPFYLYISPPKTVLKDDAQTLIEARLVPATVVYFGSEKQQDHYLSKSLLSELSPKLQADMLAAECLNAVTDPEEEVTSSDPAVSGKGKKPVNYRPVAPPPSSSSQPASSSSSPGAASSSSSKPVPKWFKVGKK